MVGIGIFSAMAVVVTLLCQPLPKIGGFLSIDAKDAVISIASFVYGPISAVLISLVAALIEFMTFSTTGWYGLVMNFASSACFSLVAALIYRKWRSFKGAMIGYVMSVIATTLLMILLNIFVTPLYLKQIGIDNYDIIANIPVLFLPFNFAKTLMNSAISMLLYKPITSALRRAKQIPPSNDKNGSANPQSRFNKFSLYTIIIAVTALAVAVAIFILRA